MMYPYCIECNFLSIKYLAHKIYNLSGYNKLKTQQYNQYNLLKQYDSVH